ncbi:hypothetical protein BBBOND_0302870 [Babesia bigemina]|uniref:Uncharacterized protein n=1 Tax=Babesia bigemina TaxID=5866 RepID=A0A061D772_BABBI|nr:hypothetical protein BBBOND_0302870 [Babesia bigemina]CDR96383.1 hypothetical protein BBBOND_0302870 [Babesia bigemina]|eukprot:XP_012768569.1 hypothetical protein BBBOND_0302870 [Babesia bigemina]
MAPKKLTDCPENLRESIDWLIQIKNCGDKKGLQNLADALGTLINQAIEDAQNSLKAEEEKLKCPIIYEGNLTYCQFNDRSLKEAEKKLEELKDKQDLESESQKQRLEKEIEQFKLSKEKCIQHTHPRYPDSKALKDVRAQLKASQELHEKLKPFLNNLQRTAKNPNDGILHNLCSGLETFLGFDAATKGYTGKGIVYSDLDRLCDAVMAFIVKCLKENKSLLMHYYSEIVDKIGLLEGSIGKGLSVEGLRRAIDTVRDGLEGYEGGMDVRIQNFLDNVKSLNNDLYVKVKTIESFTDKDFIKVSTSFRDSVEIAIRSIATLRDNEAGFKNIDKHLKGKLNISLEKIDERIKGLHNALQDDIFVKAVNTLQSTFDTLPDEVERFISNNVTGTISGHRDTVVDLKRKVKEHIDVSRDNFQVERLRVCKVDMEKAIATFRKNAKNLGGLRSDVVKKAIDEIEYTLKDEVDKVEDESALNSLKINPVGTQIGNITKEINRHCEGKCMGGLRGLEKSIGEPKKLFDTHHQRRLSELVKHAKTNIEKTLKCADEHAKYLGGLRNDAVVGAIKVIQEKLDEVNGGSYDIDTFVKLTNLKSQTVDVEVKKIQNVLNDGAETIIVGLRGLEGSIKKPEDLFNKHKDTLLEFAEEVQNDFQTAVSKAQECITRHGGMHNNKIMGAFNSIEKTLKGIETPNKNAEDLSQVVALVEGQLAQVNGAVRASAPTLQSTLTAEFTELKHKIGGVSTTLTDSELKSLITTTRLYIVDAICAIECHGTNTNGTKNNGAFAIVTALYGILGRLNEPFRDFITTLHITINSDLITLQDVNGAFKEQVKTSGTTTLLKSLNVGNLQPEFDKSRKAALKPLLDRVKNALTGAAEGVESMLLGMQSSHKDELGSALRNLKRPIESLNTTSKLMDFESQLGVVDAAFDKVRTQMSIPLFDQQILIHVQKSIAEIKRELRRTIITAQATAFQTAIDIARAEVGSVVQKAKTAIQTAESEYQLELNRLCANIDAAAQDLQNKASKHQIGDATAAIIKPFSNITNAITSKSVFSADIAERQQYFDNLQSQITNTIATIHEAYKNAYRSAAKSYLSGAIGSIKKAVGDAETAYGSAIDTHIKAIGGKVVHIKEEKFKVAAERNKLAMLFEESFRQLEAAVKEKSAFRKDLTGRTECFNNLKTLIEDTVNTLSTAYQKAYQSSAKTYLSNAISKIKENVNNAEWNYVDAINVEIKKVKETITGIQHIDFKEKATRDGLTERLTPVFKTLQEKVKTCCAFKTDFVNRATCFTSLENLINSAIAGIIHASETFDNCTSMAENYLTESFNDASIKITSLGNKIHDRIKQAFDKIILEVYTMYSKDKIAHMKALNTCIECMMQEFKSIIEEDKRTGMKGLLKALSGVNPNYTNPENRLEKLKDKPLAKELAQEVKSYLDSIFIYVWNDIYAVIGSQFTSKNLYKTKVEKIKNNLNELFNHLIVEKGKIYNYDHKFVDLLGNVKSVLINMYPQEFGATEYPVLDGIREGLNGFTEQLGYAYINKYVGSKPIEWHVDKQQTKLSQDATRCAKIFLTLIPEWHKHIPYLNRECNKGCTDKKISLQEQKMNSGITKIVTNPLGLWFDCRGYKVSGFDKQEGELRNNSGCTGNKIGENLKTFFDKKNTFGNLLYYLYEYYKVCHIKHIPSPKPPTTICQMLYWLCGLEYTPMYENMKTYLQEWYNDFKKEHEIEKALSATVPRRTGHEVVTDLNLGNLLGSYQNVTLRASDVLLTILGYGDADGRYACEFNTNPYNLYYPTDKSKCFDMLVEICLRLNHQLRFLYMQCHNGPRSSGWADCRYGKYIAGSAWNCNRLQCVEQGCDQNCKWHNDCGVKSPLQSFLEDGLKGFLPHQFSSPSCKLECSVKNHNGIPCKTPMGFADISITASWTRTGHDIKKVLDPFCGTLPDSLSLLCAYFLCLLRRPPQTLCDMFAFYENFFEHWSGHYDSVHKEQVKQHKHDAFKAVVASANFGVEYDGLDPTTMFRSSSHSGDDATHLKGDLFAIVNCKPNENPVHPCGSYLQPLSYEVRCVFTEKLAADYLSWIVYITETFYNLLNDLYNKCTKCCIQQQADCYGRICAKGCTVDSTPEPAESKMLTDKTHGELCNSIVQCAGIHPTIYAAGFTFGSPWSLCGDNGIGKKRSCKDFCTALGMVVAKYNAIYNLVNKHIPNFLWEIRHKFFYTLVALWAYSLLYLLYVIIGRLDTLHVRSHLRLPSSHKISAQSLLATARLNNLAKLAYLRT